MSKKILEVLGLTGPLRRATIAAEEAGKADEQLLEAVATVQEAIARKDAELKAARTAYPPRADRLAIDGARVDALAARYRVEHKHEILSGLDLREPGPVTKEWLCAHLGPLVKSGRSAIIAAMEYSEGPPVAEQPAEVARLERELAEMKTEEERFIDGLPPRLKVPHRPETSQRRESERLRREEHEAREANRTAREDQINAHHAQQPRVARSDYLTRREDPPVPRTP
jgi:hypothetical protein